LLLLAAIGTAKSRFADYETQLIGRGVQYVYCMMHNCIMVKTWEEKHVN